MNQHKKYAVSAAALLLAVAMLFSCNRTADTDDTAESVTTGSVTVSESEAATEQTTVQTLTQNRLPHKQRKRSRNRRLHRFRAPNPMCPRILW